MIKSIKELKNAKIKVADIPELDKDLTDLGYSFLEKNYIINNAKKNRVVTFRKKDDDAEELRLICTVWEPEEAPAYLEVMQYLTNDDYVVHYVPHGLDTGWDRDNLILQRDEHTSSGRRIIYGNLTSSDLKRIREDKKWEYLGIEYPVKKQRR